MENFRKRLFFLVVIIGILALGLWFFLRQPSSKEEPKKIPTVQENQYQIRPPEDFKSLELADEREKKAMQKQLHEGNAFFADTYRLEVSLKKEKNQCSYLLFIDNYFAQPLLPRGTSLKIITPDTEQELRIYRNGLMAAFGPCPKNLPVDVKIRGVLGRKYFEQSLSITSYRKKPVQYHQKKK